MLRGPLNLEDLGQATLLTRETLSSNQLPCPNQAKASPPPFSSRVSDYKHHWSDVLSGGILGSVVALVTGFSVAKMFARRETAYQVHLSRNSDSREISPKSHPTRTSWAVHQTLL